MKPAHLLPAWLLSLLLLAPVLLAQDEQPSDAFDRWFVLTLQGQRAGWSHMTQMREAGDIVTTSELHLAVKRGPVAIEIEQSQRFRETPEGKPVDAESSMKMGAMAVTNAYRWTDAGIENTTGQGAQTQTKTLPPIAGEWFTPAAAQRHVEAQIAAGAEEIRVRTLDLSMGVQPIEAVMRVLGEQNVEVFGKTVPAIAWEATLASMPGVQMKEYVDADGRTLKTTVSIMPGMDIEMIAADEALARAELNPPEVLAALMIHPGPGSVKVEDPRALTQAVYEVTVKANDRGVAVDFPRTGYQRVVWGDEKTAKVVVDLASPVNPEADLPGDEHLAASTMLNHGDEAVRALVAEALGDAGDLSAEEKALRLRAFVHDHMDQKNLAVGFATASEVARTREGDCSEHGVLLAALLRAAGIPSRVASGLLYVEEFVGKRDVLGGHMWTQAWIEPEDGGGRWIDLDATLPEPAEAGFDAAHITLAVSTLNDDRITNELVELAPLLGMLEVKIVAAEAAAVGAGAP